MSIPDAGDTVTFVAGVPTVTRTTNQWKLTVPAFTLWNVGASYRWKQGTRLDHTLRFNVNNAFDRDYLKVNKNIGDGRGIYFSYTLAVSGRARN